MSFATPIRLATASPNISIGMVRRPVFSAQSMIVAVVTGKNTLAPELTATVIRALGPDGLSLYAPIRSGSRAFYPRLIVPAVDDTGDWPSQAAERVADLSDEALLADLHDMQRLRDGAGWDDVIAAPRAWLLGISAALRRVCVALEPWWRRAEVRLEVEQARLDLIGSTPLRGRRFVNELSSSVRLTSEALLVKWSQESLEEAGEQIILTPMLSSDPKAFLVQRGQTGTTFGYPMAAWLREPHALLDPTDRLVALLGAGRAQILRLLDRPHTMSWLAYAVGLSVPTAHHHIVRLVAAGLVETMRLGRVNWVVRTEAGDGLLHLME